MSGDGLQRDTRQPHFYTRFVLFEQRLSVRKDVCTEESVSRELLQYPMCEMQVLQVQ